MKIPAILMLMFNRPDLAERVFARIRDARPERLFIACDGPRPDHPGEAELCKQSRQIAELVDWPCEVKTLFREKNLGCRSAVSSAITWFFEHVEAGIILEDDCLPDPSFFPFCAELLERYSDNAQIMSISGDCFHAEDLDNGASYSFSIYHHIWGWATWRRAWRHYDSSLINSLYLFDLTWLRTLLGSERAALYWIDKIANLYYDGHIDTWDLPWLFSCWKNHGLSIVPAVNLVTNIGFDQRATHTKKFDPLLAMYPSEAICLPIRHPADVRRNKAIELSSERLFLPREVKPECEPSLMAKAKKSILRQLVKMSARRHQKGMGGSAYERAVLRLRSDPGQKEFVRLCYLDDPMEAAKRFAASDEFAEVCNLLSLLRMDGKGKRVLDVGCGNGIASFAFASLGCDVVALEPDPSPIVGAGALAGLLPHLATGSIPPVGAPVGEYQDSSGGFDIVYMRQVAHHFPVLEEGIAGCVKLLKPKGIFMMTREHVADTASDVEIFKQRHALTQDGVEECAYPADRYRQALLRAGLSEIRELGPYDSVINYYPTPYEIVRQKAMDLMYGQRGWIGVVLFCLVPSVERKALRSLSELNRTPGRLFTFLGVKRSFRH